MKKSLMLLVCCFSLFVGRAQYCGNNAPPPFGNPSDSGQCTPSGNYTKPGLFPYDSILPLINGEVSTTVIEFKNWDTIAFGNQYLTVQWLRFDSIHLPDGLCWATNVTNNVFNTSQSGCIKLNGLVCSTPGQFRLKILVTANIGIDLNMGDNQAGLICYLRVKNAGDADTPVDTNGQAANTNIFVPYGNGIVGCNTGINESAIPNSKFQIFPSPATNQLNISIDESLVGAQLNIYNVTGSLVQTVLLSTANSQLSTGNLPNGVYIAEIKTKETRVIRRWVKM